MRNSLLLVLVLAACGDKSDTGQPPAPDCDASSPETLAGCVDPARYADLLETLAVPRGPGSESWQAVQDLCDTSLEAAGFTVERQDYGSGVNVVGTLPAIGGTADTPPVLISAHYDSIANCAGADDNASGVAGALEAARVLGWGATTAPLVVACWDEEEQGLVGSEAWVQGQADQGGAVSVSFVLEMIGFQSTEPGSQSVPDGFDILFPDETAELEDHGWTGDFIAIVADEHAAPSAEALAAHMESVGSRGVPLVVDDSLSTSRMIGDLRRSDHAPFWDQGWPAMMITDTSEYRYGGYHCHDFDDTVDQLDTDFASSVVAATVAAAARAAGLVGPR